MKKNIILYVLLIFLVFANGFFLFNYIGNNHNERPNGQQRPDNFIVKELGFNDLQLKEFKDSNQMHHQSMMKLSRDLKEFKDLLFDELAKPIIEESTIDSITTLIGQKEKEKETEVFYHFKRIQDICTDEQKEKFKGIINDALQKGGERGQNPPPPRGNRPPPRE